MTRKTIFLCEINHGDQAMRIAQSLVVNTLIKSGYNQLFVEWSADEVEIFYDSISENYQFYKDASHMQIFRLFELSKKCLGDSEHSIGAELESYITDFAATLSGLQIQGFESTSREVLHKSLGEVCEVFTNKQLLRDLVLEEQIKSWINVTAKSLTTNAIEIAKEHYEIRNLEIVNNFAKLHNNSLKIDKNIIIAGDEHCVDFYNYASKEGILNEFSFVQIKSNLTTTLDPDSGDTFPIEMQKDQVEFGVAYICDESILNQIKENWEYIEALGLNDFLEEDLRCEIKYSDYVQDQANVIHCNINVNDIGSYYDCLHNVTHLILDAV